MKINKVLFAFIIVGVFVGGIILGCLIPLWCSLEGDFFKLKFIELIQLLFTIMLAVTVSYFISGKVNRDIKQREIINEIVTRVQGDLTNILEEGYTYIENPDKERERKIKMMVKNIGMLLNLIEWKKLFDGEEIENKKPIYQDFVRFKRALTDTPFGREKEKYSKEQISMIQERFDVLWKRLYKLKLRIYS